MIKRDELIKTIHEFIGEELLAKANQLDENANGVQIHGAEEVKKIALGVSATLDFFKEAADSGAQFCLTHHGIHLASRYLYNSRLDQAQQAILRYVFAHNITVVGYHATLDMHPEIGNNATIIRELGAKRLNQPYFMGWGWLAEFKQAQPADVVASQLSDLCGNDVFAVYSGPNKIKRFGVCSGGAKPSGSTMHEIYDQQLDLHIAGEITHSGIHLAKEAGFNYFAAGHYATEVFGVQELGKRLKEKYQDRLEVEFIDIPNPL
jgi:dinuclear metal center YbgI/SA1388 family protein